MKNKIIWLLLVLIILSGGVYFYKKNYDADKYEEDTIYVDSDNSKDENNDTVNTVPNSPGSGTIDLSSVQSHNSASSCWSTIGGKVYDLTSFIGKHPGGSDAILAICGKDGSSLFDGQHGMDPKAKSLLPNFYLGDLAN